LIRDNKIVGYERFDRGRWRYSRDGITWNDPYIIHDDKDQYTGRKDHHDVEVYENDIVNWFDTLGRNDVPFVVAYQDAQFILTVPHDQLPGRYVGWALDSKELEVIGNTHDTPDLLRSEGL
jgi:uncharacterized phage protein (TIGR01671 family)